MGVFYSERKWRSVNVIHQFPDYSSWETYHHIANGADLTERLVGTTEKKRGTNADNKRW